MSRAWVLVYCDGARGIKPAIRVYAEDKPPSTEAIRDFLLAEGVKLIRAAIMAQEVADFRESVDKDGEFAYLADIELSK